MSMPKVCQEIPQKSYGLRSGVKHAAQARKLVKALPLKTKYIYKSETNCKSKKK